MSDPRHAAPPRGTAPPSTGTDAQMWIPPPFEPPRPGDFVEYRGGDIEVRRSRPLRTAVLCLLVLAAVASGGWFWLQRDRDAGTSPLSCQSLHDHLPAAQHPAPALSDGGHLPTGIPVPGDAPGRLCTAALGADSAVVAVWAHDSESDYSALLEAGGWSPTAAAGGYTVHVNGADRRSVTTTTVDGQLVAIYDR